MSHDDPTPEVRAAFHKANADFAAARDAHQDAIRPYQIEKTTQQALVEALALSNKRTADAQTTMEILGNKVAQAQAIYLAACETMGMD